MVKFDFRKPQAHAMTMISHHFRVYVMIVFQQMNELHCFAEKMSEQWAFVLQLKYDLKAENNGILIQSTTSRWQPSSNINNLLTILWFLSSVMDVEMWTIFGYTQQIHNIISIANESDGVWINIPFFYPMNENKKLVDIDTLPLPLPLLTASCIIIFTQNLIMYATLFFQFMRWRHDWPLRTYQFLYERNWISCFKKTQKYRWLYPYCWVAVGRSRWAI